MKPDRRARLILLAWATAAIAILLIGCYLFWPAPGGGTTVLRWESAGRHCAFAFWLGTHLPALVTQYLRIDKKRDEYWNEEEKLRDELLGAGYLTKFSIHVTNAASRRVQLADRLRKSFKGFENEWEFSVQSNHEVIISCRPVHVDLCNQALKD